MRFVGKVKMQNLYEVNFLKHQCSFFCSFFRPFCANCVQMSEALIGSRVEIVSKAGIRYGALGARARLLSRAVGSNHPLYLKRASSVEAIPESPTTYFPLRSRPPAQRASCGW